MSPFWRKYLSEYLGTFALVFAGCGAIIINDLYGGVIGDVGIGIVFGLIIMTMIYTLGEVSGAHFNPAVSFGFCLAGKLPFNQFVSYVVSQCVGALSASFFLKFIFPGHKTFGATMPHSITPGADFIIETLLTFFLMLVIFQVAHGALEKGLMAGVAIGGMVALEAIFAGPVTGASMNPARSLAPALVTGENRFLWIYLTAPFAGAALAVASWRVLKK